MTPLVSRPTGALAGTIRVPGDKSISHRALMLGAAAVGETVIHGLLESEDVLATAAALRALGATVANGSADGAWRVTGCGVGGLAEPETVLDMGNSGTAARLLLGLLATHPVTAVMTGDASLVRRPMARVIAPLERMGAAVVARDGGRLPLTVVGAAAPIPVVYELPVASAQVKSAVLLAALNTPGATTVIEPSPTRDHTELMLPLFGAAVTTEAEGDGRRAVTLPGQQELVGAEIRVPGDVSSAAFAVVAALLRPGSEVTIEGVGCNPLRTGLLTTLMEMGGRIEQRPVAGGNGNGEPVADLVVRGGDLKGVQVPAERAPTMIDEYPILAVAASCAAGTTVMHGVGELRVKESDRLQAMAAGLAAAGVEVDADKDTLVVHGNGRPPTGGITVASGLDHRIAMAFLVLGMAADRPMTIDDGRVIDTSFPDFAALMNGLGADIDLAGSAN